MAGGPGCGLDCRGGRVKPQPTEWRGHNRRDGGRIKKLGKNPGYYLRLMASHGMNPVTGSLPNKCLKKPLTGLPAQVFPATGQIPI